jgi:FkbM family methyltransferase
MTRPLLRVATAALRLLGRSPARVGPDVMLLADGVAEDARQTQLWQWLEGRHLERLFRDLAIDCVIDVGANDGDFAELVREAGWRGPLASFEPQSVCVAALQRAAQGDPSWRIFGMALSDHDGVASLTLRSASQLTSMQDPRLASRAAEAERVKDHLAAIGTEEIVVRRLDTVFPELSSRPVERAYLKIDTQGHDELVLTGASGVLDRVVAIQVELTRDPLYEGTSPYPDVIARLDRLGFALNAVFPVLVDPATQALLEFDGVFVRVGRPEALARDHERGA